jgi:hypothetical protein
MRMRLLFGSIAPLLLARIVLGCSWVDPDQCWPNTSGGFGGSGTIPIGAGVGATTTGDFISPPPPRGPLANGGTPNPCVTPDSPPESPGSADPFKGIDPQVLAKATLKASALAFYIDGMLSTSMVDLSDPAAFAAAFEQDAPMAEIAVDAWLPTVDPSAIPAATYGGRYDCTEKYGCSYSARCLNPGSWPSEGTTCWVDNCGSAKCTGCPDVFPDFVKATFVKSWCAYVCTVPPTKVVAAGIVMIKTNGEPLPKKGLAWCFKP